MGSGISEIDINASADAVWAVVKDFGGINTWMPGIDSCRVEGEDRILETMGMTITEKLVSSDDATMTLVYAITDGVPVEHHQGTITVTAAGEGAHATWAVEAAPDEMAEMMNALYMSSLEALKAHVEG